MCGDHSNYKKIKLLVSDIAAGKRDMVQVMCGMKRKKEEFELSQIQLPLVAFLASYNQNIPASFPHASVAMLREFKTLHPTLFKHGDLWSVARHRKRLIDWLSTQRDV